MALTLEEIEKRISDSYEIPNNVLNAVPEPMVTVRTSTYQHGPYIKDCIEGVLMQKTTFPIEFIIGEDFSTDGTREIVFEYAKKYPDIIRVITADYNIGMRANGYRCRRKYRGKYIAICEGDDYWTDPYKLQKQVDFMERNADYSMCVHAAEYVYTNREKVQKYPEAKSQEISTDKLIEKGGGYFATSSYFFKPFNTRDLPGWLSNVPTGDYYVTLIAALHGKVYYINDVMSCYRVKSEGSWSSQKRSIEWYKNHFNKHIQCLSEYNKLTNFAFSKSIKIRQKQFLSNLTIIYLREDTPQGLKLMFYHFDKVGFKIILRFVKFTYKKTILQLKAK